MPNTLAHFGVQGVASRFAVARVDVSWVFLGCVVPDFPWILQRAVQITLPDVSRYELRIYAMIQASLFFCLLICGALAMLSRTPGRVFAVLALNSLLHLLLDACQKKWANGVHVLAPFSWDLWHFDLFWPESEPTLLLTAFGLAFAGWVWIFDRDQSVAAGPRVSPPRLLLTLALALGYVLLPLVFRSGPLEADNHFVKTLLEHEKRTGRAIELDRRPLILDDPQRGEFAVATFAGERLTLEAVPHRLAGFGQVSVQGVFTDPQTVRVTEIHEHWPWFRDGSTYIGLAVLVAFWTRSALRALRARGGVGPAEAESCGPPPTSSP